MSTKTIAVDSEVYGRLARLKKESESFSKLIDRLVSRAFTAHTVAGVLAELDAMPPLSEEDAVKMETVVEQSRRHENWPLHDLS